MSKMEFKPAKRKQGVIDVHGFGEQSLAPYYPKLTMSIKENIPLGLHNRIETIMEIMEVDGISSLSWQDEASLSDFVEKYLRITGDIEDPKIVVKEKIAELTAKSKQLRLKADEVEKSTKEEGITEEAKAKADETLKSAYAEIDKIAQSIVDANELLRNLPDPTEMNLAFQIDIIKVFFILVRKQAQKK